MKNFLSRTWALFSSNVFAVSLLGILAVVSLLGTLIPQKEGPELYLKLYGEVFYRFFSLLNLTDLYASPFFYIILGLLGLSLFACSFNRLLTLLKGRVDLYAWGSFFAHLSVLIIYAGVIYGSLAGFSSYVQIEKGKKIYEPSQGFFVGLNDFNAKFDQNGRPQAYTSDLSVYSQGNEVLRRTISVNHPLIFRGIKFYQSNYGLNGLLEITGPDGGSERFPIAKGSSVIYAATGQLFHIAEIFPDLQVLHGMALETYEPTAPLALIEDIGWLVQGKPIRWNGYALKLIGATEYTGLQVKKDPGVWLVYLGFLLLTAGVGVMFYVKR